MTNDDEVKKPHRWQLTIKGTKFLPRHSVIIEADNIHRNKFGDLLFTAGRDKDVVATYNRLAIIGVCQQKYVKKANKKDKDREYVAD